MTSVVDRFGSLTGPFGGNMLGDNVLNPVDQEVLARLPSNAEQAQPTEANPTPPELLESMPNATGFSDITDIDRPTKGVLELVDGTRTRIHESNQRYNQVQGEEITARREKIAQLQREIALIEEEQDRRNELDMVRVGQLDPILDSARQLRAEARTLASEIDHQVARNGQNLALLREIQNALVSYRGQLDMLKRELDTAEGHLDLAKQQLKDAHDSYELIKRQNDDVVSDYRMFNGMEDGRLSRDEVLLLDGDRLDREQRAARVVKVAMENVEVHLPREINNLNLQIIKIETSIAMRETDVERLSSGMEAALAPIRDGTAEARAAITMKAERLRASLDQFNATDWSEFDGQPIARPELQDGSSIERTKLPSRPLPAAMGERAVQVALSKLGNR